MIHSVNAQEVLNDLYLNTSLLSSHNLLNYNKLNRSVLSDTLTLPFIDDFSYESYYPSASYWVDSQAFVNRTLYINAPTIGVATLDGLNKNGTPYSDISYAYGGADTLTSKKIDISYYPTDSISLSFFFASKGLGDAPDDQDSLVLEFLDSMDRWRHIWDTSGYIETFRQKLIIFSDTISGIAGSQFLHNGFQFRFRNYATISGNNDHWHIDYVKIRENFDTVYNEVSIKEIPSSFLSPYYQMPWNHFDVSYLRDNHFMKLSNIFTQVMDPDFNFKLIELSSGITIDRHTNTVTTPDPFIGDTIIPFHVPFVLDSIITMNEDTIELSVQYEIGYINDHTENDTVSYRQNFYNYFAYDDGSAEKAYGLVSPGSQLAVSFELNEKDTIWGVMFHWASIDASKENEFFSLTIWDSINVDNTINASNNEFDPDNIIYQEDFLTPRYLDKLNGWSYYALKDTLLVRDAGQFYVGWVQTTSELLNVGFDVNTDNNDKIHYNVGGGWDTSLFEGSIMIRPVVDKRNMEEIFPAFIEKGHEKKQNPFKIFPNPFISELNLFNPFRESVDIYDLFGRKHVSIKEGQINQRLNLGNLVEGVYLVKIGGSFCKKIVKVNQ